ncbi:hypothetical protein FEA48_30715 [Pseudomonas nitroreducens]|uniref:Uncharacterized protein n=1 Tax=Pseudomonas nitroreducens TaxID=46680 RepID=A0A5R8ZRH3_PSENT|nr:hypothetical protein [Pseudomonas nitroreducens]TLP68228.1 hypothetical protein FEA48_30715 [Pseudomonas nitroreducens]
MTTTNQQNEFIQSLDGDLNPQQAAQLLEMGLQGETGTQLPELVAQPGAAAEAGGTGQTASEAGAAGTNSESAATAAEAAPTAAAPGTAAAPAAVADADLNVDNAVILAKDGKHTIPYERLVEARKGEQQWKAAAEAAQAQLADLQADAKARAAAGEAPTKVDNQVAVAQAAMDAGIDPGIFGDFSEEDLAKGIAKLVDQRLEAQLAPRVNKALEPIQAKYASDAEAQHFNAIYQAHPDADSIFESKELADWVASQPSFVRDSCQQVLKDGTANQVVELIDRFKQDTGAAQQDATAASQSSEEELKAAAKKVIDSAKPPVPASLTDFPGGRAGGLTREEQMADMDGPSLLEAMQKMSPEQIEQTLNRLV